MKTITFRQVEAGMFTPDGVNCEIMLNNHGFFQDGFIGPYPVYSGCGDAMLALIPYFKAKGFSVTFLFAPGIKVSVPPSATLTDANDIDRIMSEDWTPGEAEIVGKVSDLEVAARAFVRASRDHRQNAGEIERCEAALSAAIHDDDLYEAWTHIVIDGEIIGFDGVSFTSTPAVVFPDRKPVVAPTVVGAKPGDCMCG